MPRVGPGRGRGPPRRLASPLVQPAHPDPPADDIRPGIGGRLREELLNAWRFDSLLEARVITENWWADDNTNRPHTAHGQLAPTEFALHSTTTHNPKPHSAWTTKRVPLTLGRVELIDEAVQRLTGSAGEFSLAISNVPGPANLVSVADRGVQHLFSSSEPGTHHALRISAISCAGEIGIGLCTDPSAPPGIAGLTDAIERSYAELRSVAMPM